MLSLLQTFVAPAASSDFSMGVAASLAGLEMKGLLNCKEKTKTAMQTTDTVIASDRKRTLIGVFKLNFFKD